MKNGTIVVSASVCALLVLGAVYFRYNRGGESTTNPIDASELGLAPTQSGGGAGSSEPDGHTPEVADVREGLSTRVPAADDTLPSNSDHTNQELAEQLDRVLQSFYGPNPRIDDLQALVARLGELASVVPDTVTRDESTGEITGSVEIRAINKRGTFRILDNRFSMEMAEWSEGDTEYARRELSLQFTSEHGNIEKGQIAVQHYVNASDPSVVNKFIDQKRIVGWLVNTSLASGTKGTPIEASTTEDGSGLVIGPSRSGGTEVISREWDWNLGYLGSWYQVLSETERR